MSSDSPTITTIATLDRLIEGFALAVEESRFIFMSGGNSGNANEPSEKVQRLDAKTGLVEEMPTLIQARYNHGSIVTDGILVVLGGCINASLDKSRLIEILNLATKQAWHRLLEHEIVGRSSASVTSISPHRLAIFGGNHNDGYLLNLKMEEVKPILGKVSDFKFNCKSQTQWLGSKRHITLGNDANEEYVQKLSFEPLLSLIGIEHN